MRKLLFKAGFERSRKGNLWCKWEGLTLTIFGGGTSNDRVFGRSPPGFGWCIADDETRFSSERYATEDEAMNALWNELMEVCHDY